MSQETMSQPESPEKAGHIRVPDSLAKRKDLDCEQKMILAYIGRMQEYQSGGASCTLTHRMIGDAIGLSERRIMDIINGTPYKDKKTGERKFKPGIPEADLKVVKHARPEGAAKNPPNHYSATWAAQRAQRRKYAKQAEVVPFPSGTDSVGDMRYGFRSDEVRAHVPIRNLGE